MSWLRTSSETSESRGGSNTTVTVDTVSEVTAPNQIETTTPNSVTTSNKGASVQTAVQGAGTTTKTGTNTTVVKDDEGGNVSFVIPIRGGLFSAGNNPLCPLP